MKRLYRNLAGFMVVVALIFSPAISSAKQLQLEISLSDTSYYICRSIWLDAQLTNISADTVRIRRFLFPGGDNFNIVITSQRGDTLRPVFIWEFLPGSGFLLNPKETYYHCFDLTEVFHNYEVGPSSPVNQFTTSLAPGEYEVSAEYCFGHKRISTPKIPFEVIKPTGTEAEVLKLYIGAYQGFLGKNYQLSKEKLIKIITSYSESIYAERAYWKLKKYDELLEKCPNSGFNLTTLRTLTNKMNKKQKQEFLQKIIKKHPDTRSAKFAEQMLRLRY